MYVACGHGTILLWRHCDMLCTSDFTDDTMSSHHGMNGPETSTMLCLKEFRQLEVPVGCEATTVFGQVYQNVALGQSLLPTIDVSIKILRKIYTAAVHKCQFCHR